MSFKDKLRRYIKLYEDMEKKMAEEDLFNKEFMTLKARSLQWKNEGLYPADAGSIPINRKKNRFKDILPFEYTRVQLHFIEGIEHSDYINANYITGPNEEVEYIAAQGPLPHTVGDFWRMLWYHNIEIVVMACRVAEMGKVKCEKYWSEPGETKEFGPISVTCTKEVKSTEDVTVRDLHASCDGEVQLIRQYHYHTWPDHDKPSTAEPLIHMLDDIREYQKRKETPIVVHCSAGCGRTGTVISTDYIRTMINNKNLPTDLSIFGIVEAMRRQRPAMVQTKNQYHFLHIAAENMAKMAITADSVPEHPTAPKPTFKVPASAPSASKSDYINTTKIPDYANAQPDYTNLSQQSDDPGDQNGNQMYENREAIMVTGADDKPKPGTNPVSTNRPPKASPRTLSPIPPAVTPRTETAPSKQPPKKPDRPNIFSSIDADQSEVNVYSSVDYAAFKDKGPEITAVFEDSDVTVPFSALQGPLDSSIRSVPSPNKSKNISDILMDVLDGMDEPEVGVMPSNFGGPGDYMMMDDDDDDGVGSSTPKLPRRTEESKQLLGEEPMADSLYCEPAPVWSSPSKPPKIDDNVSNSPPPQRKIVAGPTPSVGLGISNTPSKPSSKSNILSIFRNKGGQTASTRHKKITSAEISSPVGPLTKGSAPEGLGSLSNRLPVPITSPLSSRSPATIPNPGSTIPAGPVPTAANNSLTRPPVAAGGANSKYNFPGELGFGKRVQKPKGPRNEPDSWSRWKFSHNL